MGGDLFDRFPEQTAIADRVLGTPVAALCLRDEGGLLRDTRWAQPALFVVEALSWLAASAEGATPDFLAGHSLGEYAALFAAGCLGFADAVALVRARGELMARAGGGGMTAVIGLPLTELRARLTDLGDVGVDVANDNADDQVVLSGPRDGLAAVAAHLGPAARCVPLAVSAAFHSRHMRAAAREFEDVLAGVRFAPPRIPVLSTVTARPHDPALIADMLALQVRCPVRWRETVEHLRELGVREIRELGPGTVLTGLWRRLPPVPEPGPESLGDPSFRADYGVRWAYLAGGMYRGVSSVAMLDRLGKAGLMGFLGTGGFGLADVTAALDALDSAPGPGRFGVNLLAMPDNPALERDLADLCVRRGVRHVEAAGFTDVTAALVRYRFAGAHLDATGRAVAPRLLLAKVSRPEVAARFLAPPPGAVLAGLVASGALTAREAAAAERLPVATDLCAEADSAGHTDARSPFALVPGITAARDRAAAEHGYRVRVRVGAAGGIGTPTAVAAAFTLGADFVVTGSVNQATPEAGTSDAVKDMLAAAGVQDTAYAPAGDTFETGGRVQVLRRGTLFAARATRLVELHRRHGDWDAFPAADRAAIERDTFRKPFADVWRETQQHYRETGRPHLAGTTDPARRTALALRWYFATSTSAALGGDTTQRANFQVHTGPAIGAFNDLVRGTALADWRLRHVDVVADVLMRGAAEHLHGRRAAHPTDPPGTTDPANTDT
ncbi:acyltransferase [Actinokineospora bangkokensis]|uniref:[acyl-carrier-protein] S-malonyltransferase n=2 Tax=Actinokineospora bangkokensis TaxID=1193682 RepID=A0A1Q9LSA3_9PSEU|nr:acyltransferase [Actinokineospora bangkokensis]